MVISNYIKGELGSDSVVTIERFGDIIIYLLHHGVICRSATGTHAENDPAKEKEMYDDFLIVENSIRDYLSVIGMRVKVNKEFETIRVYPPDADYPGNKDVVDSENNSSFMKMHISKDVSVSLVILYLLYDQHTGKQNPDSTVVISEVDFLSAFQSKLGSNLSEALSTNKKRKEDMYKDLKKLRAINYNKDFFSSEEQYPIVIRPTIFDLVPESIIKDIMDEVEAKKKEIENV